MNPEEVDIKAVVDTSYRRLVGLEGTIRKRDPVVEDAIKRLVRFEKSKRERDPVVDDRMERLVGIRESPQWEEDIDVVGERSRRVKECVAPLVLITSSPFPRPEIRITKLIGA